LKKALKARQKATREAFENQPQVRKIRNRRRLFRLVVWLVILMLLLLIRCDCGPPKPPMPQVVEPMPVEKEVPDAGLKRPVFKTTVKTLPRDSYENKKLLGASWLEQFQMQVVARSPRLAECFVGVDRPGALRWTCALNADTGVASDHEFEPLGTLSGQLSKAQENCVVEALSKPAYTLSNVAKEGLPQRIGFVLEF
jgi:hypothetical protein